MSPTLKDLTRALKAAEERRDVAKAASDVAQAAWANAERAHYVADAYVTAAKLAISVYRGRVWLDAHPEAHAVVKAWTDYEALQALRLGRERRERYYKSWFKTSALGADVNNARESYFGAKEQA